MRIISIAGAAILAASLSVAASAADYSSMTTEELMKMNPSEMSEEERSAFRKEMRERSVNMSDAEREQMRNEMRQRQQTQGDDSGQGGMQGQGGGEGGMSGQGGGRGGRR